MNCPSRTDEPPKDAGWNQNPPGLSADLTTRQDLNGIVNLRTQLDSDIKEDTRTRDVDSIHRDIEPTKEKRSMSSMVIDDAIDGIRRRKPSMSGSTAVQRSTGSSRHAGCSRRLVESLHEAKRVLFKFGKFVGPGFIISVAYIDPGNYSTDVAAGAATRFKLLFMVLMSNVFAIVLQSLSVRLGTVTGMNLAEHCRAHLPKWLNLALYILGEAAIIATDIAEVIGSAIALNLLLKIPLVAGCAITLVDVLVILIFYSSNGSMRRIRAFEYFVMALVLGVVICFCIQLSLISSDTTVGSVFDGYLPSAAIVRGQGLYLSCGVLGATVMPHSLYLGSGMVQARLREFDITSGHIPPRPAPPRPPPPTAPNAPSPTIHQPNEPTKSLPYQPSLAAIRHGLNYSTAEVALSLFTFALFVNSAILIVAGASLYNPRDPSQTDSLFSIHDLLSSTLAPAAGTIFALALLLSGTSAGIVCTIAGQMLSEGALNWTIRPWMRRLLTRSLSITPSIIIAGAVGKPGLSAALNASQVALSIVLPFVSAPLIYFTCRNKYMVVGGNRRHRRRRRSDRNQASDPDPVIDNEEPDLESEEDPQQDQDQEQEQDREGENGGQEPVVKLRNHIVVSVLAVLIWLVIAIMNVSLLVFLGLGDG